MFVLAATLIAAVIAVGGSAAMPQSSKATTINFCGVVLAAYDTCQGPRHSLLGVIVNAGYRKCAGAKDNNGNFYGSYNCAISGTAYHCYGGQNLLYGMAHNGHDGNQTVYGQEGYTTYPCPP